MPPVVRMQNRRGIASASLAVALTGSSASGQTLTPTSYAPFNNAGYTSGQGTLIVQTLGVPASREVLLVTDFSVHPFPIERAQDGTAAVSHPIGADVAIAWTEKSINALVGHYVAGTLEANAVEVEYGPGLALDASNPARPVLSVGEATRTGASGEARVRSPAERLALYDRFG
jgi:hypothetical protein